MVRAGSFSRAIRGFAASAARAAGSRTTASCPSPTPAGRCSAALLTTTSASGCAVAAATCVTTSVERLRERVVAPCVVAQAMHDDEHRAWRSVARCPGVTLQAVLATRAGPLPDSRLAARRLGRFDCGLCASPAHASRFGLPVVPAALHAHRLVVFTGDGARAGTWTLHHPQRREPVCVAGPAQLRVNAGAGVRSALLAGLGIGHLPQAVVVDLVADGRLLSVLAPRHAPAVEVFAVYPSNRDLTPKVRAFVDLALAIFPGPPAS
ncbi:substrate binding domain-containing protein [Rubrivivax sp. RP6-9]|uniref:substrate binding domain-containing protein n=1 Tax=Rubrivivax sp. RP6-9 TaxID=3415750 RepID=UPI003CC62D10